MKSSSCFFMLFFPSSMLFASFTVSYKLVTDDGLFKDYYQLKLPQALGPESITFDCSGGGPYTGVSDGRILKWQGVNLGWTEFAITSQKREREFCDGSTDPNKEEICGRPLGLKFNRATCDLYIADAYYGLLRVGPNGGVAKQLATSAEGMAFRFTNNLDIDTKSGVVYFTDTSTVYQRREYFLAIINGDETGRLIKFDMKTKKVTVLLKGLAFANGVALSKDRSFLLVAETSKSHVLKYWLKGPKAQKTEIFAQFEGFPDNIERTEKGDFWVALDDGTGSLFQANLRHERVIKTASLKKDVVAAGVRVDKRGKIVEVLDQKVGSTVMESVSEVQEHNETLWVGSLAMHYVCLFKT